MEKHDVDRLETSITEAHDRLRALAEEETLLELIRIIRQPGWTTPAEFTLVSAIVEGIGRELELIGHLTRDLLEGSRQVTAERAAV